MMTMIVFNKTVASHQHCVQTNDCGCQSTCRKLNNRSLAHDGADCCLIGIVLGVMTKKISPSPNNNTVQYLRILPSTQ